MQIPRAKKHQILHHSNSALKIRVQRPLLDYLPSAFVQRDEAACPHVILPGVRARFAHQDDIVDDGWRNQRRAVIGDWCLPYY